MNQRQSISSMRPASAVARALAKGWSVFPGAQPGRTREPVGEELIDLYPSLYGPGAEVCLCGEDFCTTVRSDELGHLCIHCGEGVNERAECFSCGHDEDDE